MVNSEKTRIVILPAPMHIGETSVICWRVQPRQLAGSRREIFMSVTIRWNINHKLFY